MCFGVNQQWERQGQEHQQGQDPVCGTEEERKCILPGQPSGRVKGVHCSDWMQIYQEIKASPFGIIAPEKDESRVEKKEPARVVLPLWAVCIHHESIPMATHLVPAVCLATICSLSSGWLLHALKCSDVILGFATASSQLQHFHCLFFRMERLFLSSILQKAHYVVAKMATSLEMLLS